MYPTSPVAKINTVTPKSRSLKSANLDWDLPMFTEPSSNSTNWALTVNTRADALRGLTFSLRKESRKPGTFPSALTSL